MNEENVEAYERARNRVHELRGFYSNLVTYIIVNVFLIIINLATNPHKLWFYWVTIFWGIAVLIHASKTFVLRGKFLGSEWEEKKIREIMEKSEHK